MSKKKKQKNKSRLKAEEAIRACQAAKSLCDPRFQPKIAKTDKKKRDPKISRRKWKNKGEY